MQKIGPLFKWFGSKWQAAKRYPKPKHETIYEPYAGGAGYSLNYTNHNVILWDEDPNLKVLWKWLIDSATDRDIREIPINLTVGADIRKMGLSRGQAMLLKHWQRTNNVGDCWTISPWGNLPGQWTANTRARVADQVGAIKHWQFIQPCDFDSPATWFIDPPYLYNYRYRSELGQFDYQALVSAEQTISRQSQVIICEAVGKAGQVPDYLPFVPSHKAVNSRRTHSKELVYIRG